MDTTKIIVMGNVFKDTLKENSHKILLGTSIIAGITAVGFAIKKGMEVDNVLEEHNERLEAYKLDKVNDPNTSETEYKKGLAIEYVKTCGYLANHFKWPIMLELVAIGTACGAVGIEEKRYLRASATAAAFYTELSTIKEKVAEKYGTEALYELENDIIEEEIPSEDGKKKNKVKVAKNTNPGSFSFFIGKDYCKFWNPNISDEQNLVDMKMRLYGAIQNSNRDVFHNGYVWFDKIADRIGLEENDLYRKAAIVYDLDNYDEHTQVSTKRNVIIHDAHILDGGEKVILVEFKNVDPCFSVNKFDKDKFFADRRAYNEVLEANE